MVHGLPPAVFQSRKQRRTESSMVPITAESRRGVDTVLVSDQASCFFFNTLSVLMERGDSVDLRER